MSNPKNHHFIPQYYFRLFNGGKSHICMYAKESGRTIKRASIKGQCAKRNLHGHASIEQALSEIEEIHSWSLKRIVAAANSSDSKKLSNKDYVNLYEAVLLQRRRTLLEFDKQAAATQALGQDLFRRFLEYYDSDNQDMKLDEILRSGEFTFAENRTSVIVDEIPFALHAAFLIIDLEVAFLRNRSNTPFIFSDSPVIFFNKYYKNVEDRGVLGLQTPGLMIFLPLTPNVLVMLVDPNVYNGIYKGQLFVDVTDPDDVDNLNILQMHHSRDSIYFADERDADYVGDMYRREHSKIRRAIVEYRVRNDIKITGQPDNKEVMQFFEPQINHDLSISFVSCKAIARNEYVFRHRSPWLVRKFREKPSPWDEINDD